ncbi:MAG: T9SS C-terminal target domain-containing protein [Candidatus Zixiibacteriota bacterium]|nr:MAG: T9SS C-terminal target domain-containing protein [candidate division Zixibacteria bacterium]
MKRLILLSLLLGLPLPAARADWPLLHGNPARTGHNPEITTAGLVHLWEADLESPVYASPVMAAGRVYVGTADARLVCLDAATGATLWQQMLGSWSEGAPAVAGGRIYLGASDHKVYCFDAVTGAPLWQAVTGSWVESSPLVFQDQVYVGGMDHRFRAYQAATGNPVFSLVTDGDVRTAPSTDGQNVFFSGDDEMIHALTPAGAPLWTVTAPGAVYSAPVAAEGKVVFGSIANGGGLSFNRLTAVSSTTGAVVWQRDFGPMDFRYAAPAVGYGAVYTAGFQGSVSAYDLDDGAPLWTRSLGDWALLSSPALANGALYLGSNEGKVYVLDAFTGAVLDWAPAGGFVESSPAVAGGRLVVGSADGRLRAFDLNSPVSVTLTPGSTTVPPGGTLEFSAGFDETAGQAQGFQAWIRITRPTGQQINFGAPAPLSLAPGQQLTLPVRLGIPAAAPPGGYLLAVNAGPNPGEIWDAASFAFTITGQDPGGDEAAAWDLSWGENAGEPAPAGVPQQPAEFALAPPHPNPFNPATTVPFSLPQSGLVRLAVYDALGRRTATLLDGVRPAGVHEAVWDASGVASGIYFFRLEAGGRVLVQRGMLLK